MASEPLRNACNAQRPIHIRLDLSLAEGRQLQQWLTAARHAGAVDDDHHPDLQRMVAKLSDAADQAVRLLQCPVCQAWFAQGTLGRSGQYCTAACKQKAYRQRLNARKRQPPAPKRRH